MLYDRTSREKREERERRAERKRRAKQTREQDAPVGSLGEPFAGETAEL